MALPTGLIPVLAFVLTVGISVPVTLAAHLLYQSGTRSFGKGLRVALLEAGLLYLVGVVVVWAIAGGGLDIELWEIPITLIVTGVGVLFVLTALPLAVGRNLIQRFEGVDSETALRYATYGWPLALLVVFGIFIVPDGRFYGRFCLAGFCGLAGSSALAVLVEAVVAVFGPGLIGLLLVPQR